VCLEKGAHLALDVAEKTGLPIVLAGKVFPFSYHRLYFDQEIAPRLRKMGDQVRFVESPSLEQKVRLIQSARALLVPSLVDETSSLVSMEAAACGTPVIAYRRGALPEVVQDGVTGLFASSVEEMAAAVEEVSRIEPSDCRQYAEENFSSQQMVEGYLNLYRKLWKKQEHGEAARELAAA
jgi:glycosyltransferase involved in cell wall biosynthesis